MNKIVLLTLIGTLLSTGGCSFFSNFADSRKDLEENTAKSIPTETEITQTQLDATEDFADLELEQSATESLPEIAGLIPATNPDVRARSSIRGRNDPFAVVALNPRIQIKEEAKQTQKEPAKPSNRIASFPQNQVNPDYSNQAVLAPPAPPEPTLANNVVISGIYKANGRTRVIVKAPDEESSRYVEVGDYLSNGQVLVKRVAQNGFSNPTVILEQSGTEVEKTIGEDSTNGSNISSLPTATPSYDWGTAISLK
ncbi:MAG: hypothetical protein HC775_15070 [Hyellaceae cyanobacterium CSU_1_1]|nr:hypothetical protein [Hyellaceae cyanobacterium CSU_1_1]